MKKELVVGIIIGLGVNEARNFIKRKKEDIYFEKEGLEAIKKMYYKGITTEMIAEILDLNEEVVINMLVEKEEQ